jgi:hypothetical protein
MPDPTNPNPGIPERTEPAVTPEPTPDPVDPEIEGELQESPEERLGGTLSNPATIKAVIEFLKEQNLSIDDVTIEEGMWGWSQGSEIAHVELGNSDYFVSPDSDTTSAMAIALVTNDLREEPGLFNQDWLQSYIDTDRVARDLRSDVEEQVREQLRGDATDALDSEEGAPSEEEFEEKVERETDQILRDPISYLTEIFGAADGIAKAMEIGGINIDEAAEDAVAADGEGHFLSTYDGEVRDLPSGGNYWRHN